MAYNGVPPKPDGERVRRNAPVFQRVPLEWDGLVRGPKLPIEYSWCRLTQEWWEKFRRSPQSMVCVESDWLFLIDTALLYDRMWRDPLNIPVPHLSQLSGEFRRRMSAYGTTFDDRLKQRIEIITPQSEAAEKAEISQAAHKGIDYLSMMNAEVARLQEDGTA